MARRCIGEIIGSQSSQAAGFILQSLENGVKEIVRFLQECNDQMFVHQDGNLLTAFGRRLGFSTGDVHHVIEYIQLRSLMGMENILHDEGMNMKHLPDSFHQRHVMKSGHHEPVRPFGIQGCLNRIQ